MALRHPREANMFYGIGFLVVGGWMWQRDSTVLALICFGLGIAVLFNRLF